MQRALVQGEDQQIGRRGRNRLRARLAAKLFTLNGTLSTVLLDLSQTGARIKAGPHTARGQQAILAWTGYEAFGAVVWVDHGVCGIVFDEPLDPDVLVATRDLDSLARLPSDSDLVRGHVQEWVAGKRRI